MKSLKLGIWILLILGSLAVNIHAGTVNVATTGNDLTGDGSIANPFQTIQKAINESGTGDIVIVQDGTYSGPGNHTISFIGKAITVQSLNGYQNCTIDCGGNDGFIFENGEDATSVLTGISICNANAGINVLNATPSISYNNIYDTVIGVQLTGIEEGSSVNVHHNTITENEVGVRLHETFSAKINNNVISYNTSDGINLGSSGPASGQIITDLGFKSNIITHNGGCGIYGSMAEEYHGEIEANSIVSNHGDGIKFFIQHSPQILRNLIKNNKGYAVNLQMCDGPIINNLIVNNTLGGIYSNVEGGSVQDIDIINNTIVGNGGVDGKGIWINGGSPDTVNIRNNIVFDSGAYEICLSAHSIPTIAVIEYNDIQDGIDGVEIVEDGDTVSLTWGNGNISSDPLFVNPAGDDYHLQDYSPCIGAGTTTGTPPTDINGVPRGTPPDIGAYENSRDIPISTDIYVAITGNDETGDGTQSNPYATIQKAINESNDSETVIVADGTYTGPGNYDIDFMGKAITVSSINGPENCIIDLNGNDGFIFQNNETNSSVLNGFTIINGNIGVKSMSTNPDMSTTPCIRSNIISNNNLGVFFSSSLYYSTEFTIVQDNLIIYNIIGVGISETFQAHIINNDISYNETDGVSFGAFDSQYIGKTAKIELAATDIIIRENNIAHNGRCGILCGGGEPEFHGIIDSNTITYNGSHGISFGAENTPKIYKNEIAFNKGSGINLDFAEGYISNNTIHNNDFNGICIINPLDELPDVTNNTIVNNAIVDGYGIRANGVHGKFFNNILHDNGTIEFYLASTFQPCYAEISYCNIKDNAIVTDDGTYGVTLILGDGNIAQDPRFVDPANDNYQLLDSSPCIGAGTADNAPDTDILGMTRGTPPDMGAYENVLNVPMYQVAEQDSLALVALYNSTDGPHWTNNTNWLTENSIDTWYGIQISNESIRRIYLSGNNLCGIIPPDMGSMESLDQLVLADNQITGPIPSEIGSLEELSWLQLCRNQLTGSIPPEIGNLKNLFSLELDQNQLTGSIPPEIGNLKNLQELSLYSNQLTGSIPFEIGNMTNLALLHLSENQLTGIIPSKIGNNTKFFELNVSHNRLSGPIPSEIKNWDYFWDSIIFLDNNLFTFNDLALSSILPGDNQDFVYSPQDTLLALTQTPTDNTIILSVPEDHPQNQYQWYCNDVVVPGGTSNEFLVTGGITGEYKCSITNPLYPDLTLWTDMVVVTPTDPFVPVTDSGEHHAIVIQDILMFDAPPQTGDWIGIFDGELCVGAIEYTGSFPLTVSAIMEFTPPVGDDLPGAQEGNPILYQLWDASTGAILPARATNALGSGVFGEPLTVVSLLESYQEQTIELASGKMNMISLNVVPEELAAETIFADIASLVIAQDDEGRFYIPPYIVNTIGDMNVSKGYKVYHSAAEPDILALRGMQVDPTSYSYSFTNTKLYLVGYPYQNTHPVADVFATISDQVVVVQDDRGNFWIPQYGVNTLGNLTPGRGYQIYVDTACDFTYPQEPAAPAPAAAREVPTLNQPEHFFFTQTGLPHAVIIEGSDIILSPGDEIAVYDGALCVGATVFTGDYPVAIPVWQKVEEYELPGYTSGHDIGIRLWRDSERNEATLQSDIAVFDGEPISVVSIFGTNEPSVTSNSAPLAYALHQNTPNPFNPVTTITYSLPRDGVVTMTVYDVTGRTVKILVDQDMSAGTHAVKWDATDDSGQVISNGIYFVRMNTGDYQQTIKVMLLK